MKKLFVFSAVAACLVFTGCKDDEDKVGLVVTASGQWGAMLNPYVDVVKAVVYYNNDNSVSTLTQSDYDAGFTLKLPASIKGSWLSPKWEGQYLLSLKYHGMNVTGDNVREISVDFEAYKSGTYIGNFVFAKIDQPIEIDKLEEEDYYYMQFSYTLALCVYVDGKATGNGKVSDEWVDYDEDLDADVNYQYDLSYDFSLEKGWNTVYLSVFTSLTFEDEVITETLSVGETTIDPGDLRWNLLDPPQGTQANLINAHLFKTQYLFTPKLIHKYFW